MWAMDTKNHRDLFLGCCRGYGWVVHSVYTVVNRHITAGNWHMHIHASTLRKIDCPRLNRVPRASRVHTPSLWIQDTSVALGHGPPTNIKILNYRTHWVHTDWLAYVPRATARVKAALEMNGCAKRRRRLAEDHAQQVCSRQKIISTRAAGPCRHISVDLLSSLSAQALRWGLRCHSRNTGPTSAGGCDAMGQD